MVKTRYPQLLIKVLLMSLIIQRYPLGAKSNDFASKFLIQDIESFLLTLLFCHFHLCCKGVAQSIF